MPSRNIYDVTHHVITKLMSGDQQLCCAKVGEGLTYADAEECVAQHQIIQPLGTYDIVFVGRAWFEDEDREAAASFEPHVKVGL
jgi:hypothetical protein